MSRAMSLPQRWSGHRPTIKIAAMTPVPNNRTGKGLVGRAFGTLGGAVMGLPLDDMPGVSLLGKLPGPSGRDGMIQQQSIASKINPLGVQGKWFGSCGQYVFVEVGGEIIIYVYVE